MKTVATIAAIAGVTMASGEGFEDHSFALRRPIFSATGPVQHELNHAHNLRILERPSIMKTINHDDIADDNFALFGKKRPQPQPRVAQTKPTNPDDVVDFEPIHVDLNSNEFFAEELGNDEFSILSSLFHKKKKPQHNPEEFKPREIPSNEFFSLKDLFHHKKKPQQPQQPQGPVEIPSNEFFAEEMGDDELSMLSSLFHKKKKPQHNPDEFKPREIPSNEFFAENLGDDEYSVFSNLFHKKKHPQQPQPQTKPTNPDDIVDFEPIHVDLNSNEFFAEELGDDNFGLLSLFKKKKKPQHNPDEFKPKEIPSNEFFSLKDLFHHKKKPQQPQQPQGPVEIPSNEFFAEEMGDDELSMLSSLFHKKKKPQHNPEEFKPREIPSNEFFSLKDLFHHKKKPQQPQQPQGPVEIPSNEFYSHPIYHRPPVPMSAGRAKVRADAPIKQDGKGSLHHLSSLIKEAH